MASDFLEHNNHPHWRRFECRRDFHEGRHVEYRRGFHLGGQQRRFSVTPTQEPLVASLGFNAETTFHQYDIEWTPSSVKYYADGVLLRTWTTNISLLRRPMNILLTIWASNASGWAGFIDTTAIPTTAEIDWIRVYNFTG